MNSDAIRALRKELQLTQRQLAEALKVEVEQVREWERDDHFPTRAHCVAMEALRKAPPPRGSQGAVPTAYQVLADPKFYVLVRKLLGHARLRSEVERMAAGYPDPLDGGDH